MLVDDCAHSRGPRADDVVGGLFVHCEPSVPVASDDEVEWVSVVVVSGRPCEAIVGCDLVAHYHLDHEATWANKSVLGSECGSVGRVWVPVVEWPADSPGAAKWYPPGVNGSGPKAAVLVAIGPVRCDEDLGGSNL